MKAEDFSFGVLGENPESHPYHSFIKEFGRSMIRHMDNNPSSDAGEIFELLHTIIKSCHVAEKNLDKIAELAQADEKLAKELEEIHEMVTGNKPNKQDD